MTPLQRISTRTPARFYALPALALAGLTVFLSGCALTDTATTHSPIPGPAISGVAFGGQQPIFAAKVYLLAANSLNGYGYGSFSLLTVGGTGSADTTIGAYTTTTSSGSFNLAPGGKAEYDCTKGYTLGADTTGAPQANLPGNEQVYLYVQGGNAGAANSSIGLLAALGPCNNIYSNTITVNELTTIAAAYAFAGYATNATHISSNNTTGAFTGLTNAGLNSANLVNLATGLPVASSTAITRPVATLITLADILASCVNGKSTSNNCSTLFNYTRASGTAGSAPNETATAAINLAHNPWPTAAGMSALYGLVPATGAPFSGALSTQPNDFTLGLTYAGGGLAQPIGIAIDASGNAWVANYGYNSKKPSVSEFSSIGNPYSPTGYTGGGLSSPRSIAIDNSGNVWATNYSDDSVSELSSTGDAISPSTGYTGNGINVPTSIAIDRSGNAWITNYFNNSVTKLSTTASLLAYAVNVAGINFPSGIAIDASGNAWTANFNNNSISELSSTGAAISSSSGFTGGGLHNPSSIAIDHSGNVWAANVNGASLSKFLQSGAAVSSSSGYTGGGLSEPQAIAIDGSGSVWSVNSSNSSVSRHSSTGIAISPSTGYINSAISDPAGIAIDGSGDVWVSSLGNNLTELIGVASPVVTPLATNLTFPYNAPASLP